MFAFLFGYALVQMLDRRGGHRGPAEKLLRRLTGGVPARAQERTPFEP